jgi:hypothetical protein
MPGPRDRRTSSISDIATSVKSRRISSLVASTTILTAKNSSRNSGNFLHRSVVADINAVKAIVENQGLTTTPNINIDKSETLILASEPV